VCSVAPPLRSAFRRRVGIGTSVTRCNRTDVIRRCSLGAPPPNPQFSGGGPPLPPNALPANSPDHPPRIEGGQSRQTICRSAAPPRASGARSPCALSPVGCVVLAWGFAPFSVFRSSLSEWSRATRPGRGGSAWLSLLPTPSPSRSSPANVPPSNGDGMPFRGTPVGQGRAGCPAPARCRTPDGVRATHSVPGGTVVAPPGIRRYTRVVPVW
jgi:hypothetical protein